MNKFIAIVVAIVNILAFVLTTMQIKTNEDKQADIKGRLQRTSDRLDNIIAQQRMADMELNFAYVHISELSFKPDNQVVQSDLAMTYVNHLQSLVVAGYDEDVQSDPGYASVKSDLEKAIPDYYDHFQTALGQHRDLEGRINARVESNVSHIKDARQQLFRDKDSLERTASSLRFTLASIQFFSLLLILVREIWGKK